MTSACFCLLLGHVALSAPAVQRAASEGGAGEAARLTPASAAVGDLESSGTKWGFHLLTILHDECVQSELALTAIQRDAIRNLGHEFLDALGPLVREHRQREVAATPDAKADYSDYQRRRAELVARFGARAGKLLTDVERKRLAEILFQLRGEEIFYYADVAEALELSEKQKSELGVVRAWLVCEARRLFSKFPPEQWQGQECQDRLSEVRGEAKRRALEVLSDRQRRQFQLFEGRPIAFSRRDLRLEITRRQLP